MMRKRTQMAAGLWFLLVGALGLWAMLMWGGCGGFPAALAKTHESVKEMSVALEPKLAEECHRRARVCKANGVDSPANCPGLTECRGWKAGYALGAKTTHRGLALQNATYHDLVKAGVLK